MGHRVISDNHLGDWGTQFGMIIYGYKHFADRTAYQEHPVRELGRLYKLVHQLVEYHEALGDAAGTGTRCLATAGRSWQRREAEQRANPKDKKLEQAGCATCGTRWRKRRAKCAELRAQDRGRRRGRGVVRAGPRSTPTSIAPCWRKRPSCTPDDPENLAAVAAVPAPVQEDIQRIYERIDIRFDHELGESFYHDRLEGVVDGLRANAAWPARATVPSASSWTTSTRR